MTQKIEVLDTLMWDGKTQLKFIVYCAKYNEEIVYIGSGVSGRELHCESGVSHVYELNKLHFSGVKVTTTVLERFSTKEEALLRERKLITEVRPRFNRKDNLHSTPKFQREFTNTWLNYFNSRNYSKSNKTVFLDLIRIVGISSLVSTNGVSFDEIGILGTKRVRCLLRLEHGVKKDNINLREMYTLFCTGERRIKIPINPPEINKTKV